MNSITSTCPALAFLLGPWLLLGLVLSGPFLVLLTVVVATLAVAAIPVLLLAPPYLLLRRYQRRAARAPVEEPRVAFELQRVVA
ncbi:hypothetical protein OM076_08860 [Solirubrobacter ginsenosidimutans]|uniref:Uncharacterized protein n=1 Tax=Solirubrobacter ginsenosidimutans TaxID=490573 RepID=A0A9X3MV18_9ACTN|nr:hypothetical protein [Solirubrobacter ginsenosidimutans]MDA0160373.1 hypothetical protein [Solirubrobacter ginsenosidimutans]